MSYDDSARYDDSRYDESAHQAIPRRERREVRAEDLLDPVEVYGSGLALATVGDVQSGDADYLWDLLTERGDIKARFGLDELAKDVAYRLTREESSLIGGSLDINALAEIELAIQGMLTDDERIRAIEDVSVRQATYPDAIEVQLTVVGDGGQRHTSVVPVSAPSASAADATP